MRSSNSENTTSPTALATPIGQPGGGHGLDTRQGSSLAIAMLHPHEVNRLVAAECMRLIKPYSGLSSDGSPAPFNVDLWTFLQEWHIYAEPAVRQEALNAIAPYLAPAPNEIIGQWLVELSVITARRPDDDATEIVRLKAYGRRLAAYPADAVRFALLERRWKFWPAWAELATVLDGLCGCRFVLVKELERERPGPDPRIEADRKAKAHRDQCEARWAAHRAKVEGGQ